MSHGGEPWVFLPCFVDSNPFLPSCNIRSQNLIRFVANRQRLFPASVSRLGYYHWSSRTNKTKGHFTLASLMKHTTQPLPLSLCTKIHTGGDLNPPCLIMSMLPHFPIPASRGSQDVPPHASANTLKPEVPDIIMSPPDSESRQSPKSFVPVGALKRRPSLSQVIGRVRSASGSSAVPDGSKSARTVRKAKSLKSLTNRPSTSPNPESTSAKGQYRRDLAPWDRTVDVVYHQYPRGHPRPDKSLDFERSVHLFLREHGRHRSLTTRYFSLPTAVRSRIWEYVMEANPSDKPIALTMARWNKDAWRPDEFSNLSEAMGSLQPYLEVSFEFRADALVHFLMTRRFHITYSLCVGTRLNPLAIKWVEKYSHYMQDIALEIVLTEYRFGLNPHAHLLVPATTRLETLIQDFVRAQLKRRHASTLNSLVILCRRFHGRRRVSSRPRSAEGSGGKLEAPVEEQCEGRLC